MKAARNDRCPCGSGRKYKNCCLRLSSSAPTDRGADGGQQSRILAMKDVLLLVKKRSAERSDWQTAEYDAQRIEITIEELHAISQRLLAATQHSRQYLFQLFRRYSSLFWEDFQALSNSNHASSEWFVEIVRAASILILRCSRGDEPWEWIEEEGVKGIDFRDVSPDEFIVLAQLFALGQLWYEAKVRYRFACKGFRVFAADGEGDALSNQNTLSIVRYEERRARYESLAGSAGLWYDPASIAPVRPDFCGWWGACAVKSGHQMLVFSRNPDWEVNLSYFPMLWIESRAVSAAGSSDSVPRHLVPAGEMSRLVSTMPYDRLINEFSRPLETALGIPADSLIAFLYSISAMIRSILRFPALDFQRLDGKMQLLWTSEDLKVREKTYGFWRDAGELGILRSTKEDWVEYLTLCSSAISRRDPSVPALSNQTVRKMCGQFTWTDERPLQNDTPWLFSQLSNHTLLLDIIAIGDFLRSILLQISLVGRDDSKSKSDRVGDATGPWLEKQAAEYFTRSLNLDPQSVARNKTIGKLREVDLAFVYRRTLFVFDCKALAKESEFMEGRFSKLRNRQSQILTELKSKLPQRIELIQQGRIKETIDPTTFDRAYGLVCTSAVEYLPLEPEGFWSNEVPLVGPPEELLHSVDVLSK